MDRRSFLVGGVLVAGEVKADQASIGQKQAGASVKQAVGGADEHSVARGSLITPQAFGAVGDGKADDSAAWERFLGADGARFVPIGAYRVNGEAKVFKRGAIGNGDVGSRLGPDQSQVVGVGVNRVKYEDASFVIQGNDEGSSIDPLLFVSSSVHDNSGDPAATKVSGIYSYLEQTGENTNQYVKSICGVSVNAAAGDNDSTGVVGYTYKLNVEGGVGDAAGAGGAAWQYSFAEGLVIGGEFSAHQNVGGTYASNFAKRGNNTVSLHVSTHSVAARCFAGISLDTFGSRDGRYGFWNAIVINSSCFAASGAPEAGTVGINFGNNTSVYPDKAVMLGNANYHLYRDNASIRAHGSTFDLENADGGAVGVRLVTSAGSQQSAYFGCYHGNLGHDGTTSLSPVGGFTVDGKGYAYLTSYRGVDSIYSRAGCSPVVDAFIPMSNDGSGSMALGAPSRLWSQVFAASGAISTSDERWKTDVASLPTEVLDAWGTVNFAQFRFKDAVQRKGSEARIHSGVLAQQVMEAFALKGLDASRYGLLCYDDWEGTPEVELVERVLIKPVVTSETGEILQEAEFEEVRTVEPGVKAGNRYGIRYEEALCLEAAYQRRRVEQLETKLFQLEQMIGRLVSPEQSQFTDASIGNVSSYKNGN